MRFPSCLLTTTPTALLVTLNTLPVFPWWYLYGIPLCMAPLPFTSTMSPTLYV